MPVANLSKSYDDEEKEIDKQYQKKDNRYIEIKEILKNAKNARLIIDYLIKHEGNRKST